MNLNDPFGRMKTRREKEYQSLRDSLIKAGVTRRQDAQELLESIRRRGRISISVVAPIAILLALLYPEAQVVSIALGGIIILWLVKATQNGQRYVQRYIDEELAVGEPGRQAPLKEKPNNNTPKDDQ